MAWCSVVPMPMVFVAGEAISKAHASSNFFCGSQGFDANAIDIEAIPRLLGRVGLTALSWRGSDD
ncbi:MAG TPA: hypothetical protein VGJ56_32020 [Reyranella sp.]